MRLFDIILSLLGILFCLPFFLFVYLISINFQPGSALFFQKRVGRDEKRFTLLKIRTMKPETEAVGTHRINPCQVTAWGRLLRSSKIDELPQLWNVLKGDMSIVGPRPCLPTQRKLIACRRKLRVFDARPGITGLAQIRGIDMSKPELLAQTDADMIRTRGTKKYFEIIFLTLLGRGQGDRLNKVSTSPNIPKIK
jgi:lipopolysaccharide/colanic/teichoic acid biosynthesis glycosyltransferase